MSDRFQIPDVAARGGSPGHRCSRAAAFDVPRMPFAVPAACFTFVLLGCVAGGLATDHRWPDVAAGMLPAAIFASLVIPPSATPRP